MLRRSFLLLPLMGLLACGTGVHPLQGLQDAQMQQASGSTSPLHSLLGTKATVVITLDPECPFSQAYTNVLDSLSRAFAEQGVAFLGLYPTTFIEADAAMRFAAEGHLDFAQVMDPDCAVADALQARVTPEAFVVDAEGSLRYRGAIDDTAVRPGRKKPGPAQHHLAEALHNLIDQGRSTPEVKAVGCIVECGTP